MKLRISLLITIVLLLNSFANVKETVSITIKNPTGVVLKGFTSEINDPAVLKKITGMGGKISVQAGNVEIPFQLIKENGKVEKLLVLCDLKPSETKNLTISAANASSVFKPKTQAELSIKEGGKWVMVTKSNGKQQWEYQGGTWKNVREYTVPKQHTDHSFDIRYEGPGWESDKIGYRFYLDWRNANDIFGKKVDTLVLQNVGIDGFDSYHVMSGWGVDMFQVGNSLGIGSIGNWAGGKANRVEKTDNLYSRIDYSGALESKITTVYSGWDTKEGKTNLTSKLSIRAGSYLTKTELVLSNPLQNICTGIIKLDSTVILQPKKQGSEWSYFATFGVQSLEKDRLGVVIFYRKSDLVEITSDPLSHVVVLKPRDNKLTWYFGANWEQDKSGVKTSEEFVRFLEEQVELLNKEMI